MVMAVKKIEKRQMLKHVWGAFQKYCSFQTQQLATKNIYAQTQKHRKHNKAQQNTQIHTRRQQGRLEGN